MIDAGDIRDGSGFLDLGLDSILAVTWIRRLNTQFGTDASGDCRLCRRLLSARWWTGSPDASVRDLPASEAVKSVAAPAASGFAACSCGYRRSRRWFRHRLLLRRAKVRRSENERPAIAVIGMSGRFLQAPDLATFWDNIRTKRGCITEVPPDRWDIAAHYDPIRRLPARPIASGWVRSGVWIV